MLLSTKRNEKNWRKIKMNPIFRGLVMMYLWLIQTDSKFKVDYHFKLCDGKCIQAWDGILISTRVTWFQFGNLLHQKCDHDRILGYFHAMFISLSHTCDNHLVMSTYKWDIRQTVFKSGLLLVKKYWKNVEEKCSGIIELLCETFCNFFLK